jgi:hypothetical protein
VRVSIEIAAAQGPGTVIVQPDQGGQWLMDVSGTAAVVLRDLEVDGGGRRLAGVADGSSLTLTGCDVHDTATNGLGQDGGAILGHGAAITVTAS